MAPKPEAQAFLDGLAMLELPPLETLDAATQRSIFDAKVDNPDAPTPPPVHSTHDRTVPGPDGDIGVRVYAPTEQADLPVIVFFHGGGWVIGTLDSHDNICRALAGACNAVVVSVDYRRAPEDPYPAAFDDCCAVVQWVADHAGDLQADGRRIAVAGDSAGGNLAAAVALWARDTAGPAIAAQGLIYPVCEQAEPETASYRANAEGYLLSAAWMNWFVEQYVPNAADRLEPYASPARAESHAGLAPAVVITAEFDPLHDDGAAYAEKLRSAGVDAVHHDFDGQIHGFATQIGVMSDASVVVGQLATFFNDRL